MDTPYHPSSPKFVHRHFLPWRQIDSWPVGFHKFDYSFCTYGLFSAPRAEARFLALAGASTGFRALSGNPWHELTS